MPTVWRSCVQSRARASARRDTNSCHTGSESAPSRPRSERCDSRPRRPHGGNRLGIRTLRSPCDYCWSWNVIQPDRLELMNPLDGEVFMTDGK